MPVNKIVGNTPVLTRVFLPYWTWEEYHAGMWRETYGAERDALLEEAIKFTGDAKLYGLYMSKVVDAWPYSCAYNLSNQAINRQAWVGHAATCLAINCPEDITRLAWHTLTQTQQDDANVQADNAIAKWESKYMRGIKICLRLG